jgi:tetratricopeptide (TPR) repeat protein
MFFNRGKLQLALGRNPEAIKDFYSAIDQTFDYQLQSISYWLAAQISLETSDWDAATVAAGRALSLASSGEQHREAAMTLARTYLLTANPAAANQVLFDARTDLASSNHRPVAMVLSAFARYLGAQDTDGKQLAAERLLTALSLTSQGDYSSFIDMYLAGLAYRELGFFEPATQYLAASAASTSIADWHRRIMFEIAVSKRESGDRTGAAAALQQLTTDNDRWSSQARLALAEINLLDGNIDECLRNCQQIDESRLDESQKQKLLQTMGFAYGRMDQPYTAALCFAGVLPDAPSD